MRRIDALEALVAETFDVLVIGGGITGVGVALDAATRGLRVALVEKDDFASGTSSKSSKLIHGGLRYLAHLEVGLVRESLKERGILGEMAPFLVRPTPFVIPRYGKRRLLAIRVGLDAYDVLALGSGFPRHHKADADEILRYAPGLRPGVNGGLVYWDARTDDARLTWTVARTAIEQGAVAANHCEVTGLLRSGPVVSERGPTGRVAGARVVDHITGEEIEVRARTVVNATGVWSDTIQALEDASHGMGIRPSKGVHLVFPSDRILTDDAALLVPAPDGRYVFVIPWEDDRVIVGTTDEDYEGSLDEPRCRRHGIDYVIDVLNRVLAEPVSRADVVATFAGLRPLIQKPGGSTKDLSRRHQTSIGPHGLVTITGGKLTTWRPMAVDAVDAALEAGDFKGRPKSRTTEVKLAGGDEAAGLGEMIAARARAADLDGRQPERLYRRYGTNALEVLDLLSTDPALAEPLHPDSAALRAEVVYAIEREMAVRPDDVLGRRLPLRILTADRGLEALDEVADHLVRAHGWDDATREREADAYRDDVEADLEAERTG